MTRRLLQGLLWCLGRLPLSVLRGLGRMLGRCLWYMNLESARVTRRNLSLCFPEQDDRRRAVLGRRSLEQTAMLLPEAGLLWGRRDERWRQLLTQVEGADYLQPEGDRRGRLLLVPHFGNWEVLGCFLGAYQVTALYDQPKIRTLDPLIRAARERDGARLLPINRTGLKQLIVTLERGGLVALLPDQVPARDAGVYAPFYDCPALTQTLAQRLVQRTRPQLLLGSVRRTVGGFAICIEPLEELTTEPLSAVVFATRLNAAIEEVVNRDPSQYQWEYKRFKHQPRGTPNPYR